MARERLGDGETLRLHLKISEEEVVEVDDWRFANRAESRSDAIRRLIQIGLLFDSVLTALVANVRDSAAHTRAFDEALDRWAASKGEEFGVRQHLLFDDESAAEFRRAYGRLLDDGSQRATMIFGLVERLADVTKADADIEAVVKDIAKVRQFYAERAAEVAGERPSGAKGEIDSLGNSEGQNERDGESHDEGVRSAHTPSGARTGHSRSGTRRPRKSKDGEDGK